jgi:phosphopantothenoylcysteine decarboxylase / phosphopantothenate---cysteine ligase
MSHRERTVALAVCGSIAAFKAVEVARALIAEGIRVVPLMTEAATRFLGAATLSGICGSPVAIDMFDPARGGEAHLDLARTADAVAIVPATADLLSRLATGRADDLVAALAMCTEAPIVVAPAMHHRLWMHPATQRNVETLRADGRVRFVGPVEGPLASGERGIGRLAEPADITGAILAALCTADLTGMRVVVTAGPTIEDLDPVRFLSNRSSGRMGFAIAERAAARGAEVTLIAGPVVLATPYAVRRVDVRSAAGMQAALGEELGPDLGGADALIMSAAVADYVPREMLASKMKKGEGAISIDLVRAPDLLAEIGTRRKEGRLPVLVGFALETGTDAELVASARQKLVAKNLDLVVANEASDGFGGPDNRAVLVAKDGVTEARTMSKRALADEILNRVRDVYAERSPVTC